MTKPCNETCHFELHAFVISSEARNLNFTLMAGLRRHH